jgi:hypothetical protein
MVVSFVVTPSSSYIDGVAVIRHVFVIEPCL